MRWRRSDRWASGGSFRTVRARTLSELGDDRLVLVGDGA